MSRRWDELLRDAAERHPGAVCLLQGEQSLGYAELEQRVDQFAVWLQRLELPVGSRVAVWLNKTFECVVAMLGSSRAGMAVVPVNPVLKAVQVDHILQDSGAALLISNAARLSALGALPELPELRFVCSVDPPPELHWHQPVLAWPQLEQMLTPPAAPESSRDPPLACLLYTSGSTGRPKGVMVSHANLVMGAESVTSYLGVHSGDRLLAALPFSFDYGLNQLSVALYSGASLALYDYLLPQDLLRAAERHRVTGMGLVANLWIRLAELDWPPLLVQRLRLITNSGGAMPLVTTRALRARLPHARIHLMYGLTEAFRATSLPPEEVDRRPDSVGLPIPGAELQILDGNGQPCAPGQPGELVQTGPLVTLGYWRAPEATARRFRPLPRDPARIAVYSGDLMRCDADGYFYFIGRLDEQIKTSGYRVSPSEIEEVALAAPGIAECVALGLPHPELGQAILLLVRATDPAAAEPLAQRLRLLLPSYQVPQAILARPHLPLGPNGKVDRALLKTEYRDQFMQPRQAR